MKRRRQPHDKLRAIKAAFSEPARINRTMTAANGAEDLGMDEQAVVDVITSLSSRDFDKSMPSDLDPTVWQDVYKPVVKGRELYVKLPLVPKGGRC
jgi:motility quorum-sensing regulator/GCU-specific mRNA interferase toxin